MASQTAPPAQVFAEPLSDEYRGTFLGSPVADHEAEKSRI
jgi:hypothetical protein